MNKDVFKIVTDLDVERIESELEDYRSSPAEYLITTYPADFTIELLSSKLNEGEIVVPDFQRQFVWNQVQASKLIESFLIGLPVPAIFLFTEYESQKYLLVDGQQRLKTISYFLSGYFGEETRGSRIIFRLKGLSEKSRFYNKTFKDLNDRDQLRLKNSVLRAFIIRQLKPEDDTSIYHVFERLNTGGTYLNNQEVRNCVFFGKFNDEIKSNFNLDDSWRKILGKPNPDKRMVDIELIIRFLSLTTKFKYEKPLKDYISKYLRRNRNPSKKFLEATEELFKKTCKIIIEILGEKPFHIKRGLNAAVLDCVMTAFAKNLMLFQNNLSTTEKNNYKKKYRNLVQRLEEETLVSMATTNEETIKKRFKIAKELLFENKA